MYRKYRVLDDCARLRDVITAFPDLRHFIPSILVVNWDSDVKRDVPKDLTEMVGLSQTISWAPRSLCVVDQITKYINDGTILDLVALSISSCETELDHAFAQSLAALKLDLEGELVEWLSLKGSVSIRLDAIINTDRLLRCVR